MIRKVILKFKNNKVASNAGWFIASKISQAIIGLIVGMISARYLGPSNYGIINYATSIVSFILPVANLGITSVLVQEIIEQKYDDGEVLGSSIFLSFCSSVVSILGILIFVNFANANDQFTFYVCFLCSLSLIFQATEMIVYWFQAKLMAKYIAIVSFIAYIVASLYKIYLLITAKNICWFSVSSSIDYALISILGYILYRKNGGGSFSIKFSVCKDIINKSKHYILSTLMVSIFAQTDKIMINHFLDDASVGYYSTAVACASLSSFVFTAIIDSFRPVIFENFKQGRIELFELKIKQLYSIIIYLCLAQSLLMTFLAKPIILLLYGTSYFDAIPALRIVVWFTTFSYIGGIRNIWILAVNQQKYLLLINSLGAISNIALNFILIPFLGIYGAAIASVFTQFFTNVVVGWIIKPIRKNNALMIKALNIKYLKSMM